MDKIGFVFAGQGAQYSGMGKSLYESSKAARNVFDRAEELRKGTIRQCFEGCLDEISLTQNAQPCLFCVDLAAAEALRENGIIPEETAGFSLGEIAAVTFSDMMALEDAVGFVSKRGILMGEAADKEKTGMMAVLKLQTNQVENICSEIPGMYPVNYNCPGQTVVSGREADLETLAKKVSEAGGRTVRLNVSGGFHSPYMAEAADKLKQELHGYDLNKPKIPVYSDVTAELYGENRKELLIKQITSPVLWENIIINMAKDGINTFIEVGAGRTLSGLIRKTLKEARIMNVQDEESLKKTLKEVKMSE
jgi:[acyl-carrier-protein] S-malonyltransferase